MASGSLGKESLVLTTDATLLTKGLEAARTRIAGFLGFTTRNAGKLATSSFSGVAVVVGKVIDGAGEAGQALFKAFKGGLFGALATAASIYGIVKSAEALVETLREVYAAGRMANGAVLNPTQVLQTRAALLAVDSALIVFKTLWQEIAVSVAPVVRHFANWAQLLAEKFGPWLKTVATVIAQVALTIGETLVKALLMAGRSLGILSDNWTAYEHNTEVARDVTLAVLEKLPKASLTFGTLQRPVPESSWACSAYWSRPSDSS